MGWTYPFGATRRSLIEERTQAWEREGEDMTVKRVCLAHCFRGGRFSGVLWAVWQCTFEKDGQQVKPEQRWITCDFIRCHTGEWGYKDMSEACGPYYFSCPLRYFELVPLDRFGGNSDWRQLVREHHARQREKRQHKRFQRAS